MKKKKCPFFTCFLADTFRKRNIITCTCKTLFSKPVALNGKRDLRGSVVRCLTRNPGVLGSSRTGSSGFFVGVSLDETLQSPSLVLVKLELEDPIRFNPLPHNATF